MEQNNYHTAETTKKHYTLECWFNLTLNELSAVSASMLQVTNGMDESRRRKCNTFHTNKVDFHQAHKNTVIHTYVVSSQMQYIKPSTQICTYDAENVFKLLNSSEKEFVEIQKQRALEKLQRLQKGPRWFQNCLKYVDSLT
jgi:hypothetical protein